MSVFFNKLEILKKTKELAIFYRDSQAMSDDLTGYLRDFNQNWLLLDLVNTENGKNNGISIIQINEVTRVRWNSQKIRSYKILAENSYSAPVSLEIDIENIETILKTVQYAYGHVNIMFDDIASDKCFIGKVVEMDDDCVILDEFPTHSSSGISQCLFKVSEITRVDAGADYEKGVSLCAQQYSKQG